MTRVMGVWGFFRVDMIRSYNRTGPDRPVTDDSLTYM
jgi:hypothetical protein